MIAQINKEYLKERPMSALKRLLCYIFFEGRPSTSRAYNINLLTTKFLKFISTTYPRSDFKHTPVFIIGMGRSGSTMLANILSIHKDFAVLNEGIAVWYTVLPESDIFANFLSYDQAISIAKLKLSRIDATKDVKRKFARIYSAISDLFHSSFVLDKHSVYTFRVSFLKEVFPKAKFIFLVRNCYDVCYSVDKWNRRNKRIKGGKIADWWGINSIKWKILTEQVLKADDELSSMYYYISSSITDDFNKACVEWILTTKEALKWMNRYKQEFLLIRYEDIVKDPVNILKEVFNFVGADDDTIVTNYSLKHIKKDNHKKDININKDKIDKNLLPFVEDLLIKLGYRVQ